MATPDPIPNNAIPKYPSTCSQKIGKYIMEANRNTQLTMYWKSMISDILPMKTLKTTANAVPIPSVMFVN